MASQSMLALQAKAAIMYEGATRLASRYNPCECHASRVFDA